MQYVVVVLRPETKESCYIDKWGTYRDTPVFFSRIDAINLAREYGGQAVETDRLAE